MAFPLCIYKPSMFKKALYLVITFGFMWFLAAFRYKVGFDYYNYIDIFRQVGGSPSFGEALSLQWENGFIALTWVITRITSDPVVIYGIYAALIYVPVMYFIYVYCDNAWLSTWLYVTLTFFYGSMNFIRQHVACSITLLGYRFLKEKKYVHFLIFIIIAATFHKTALILIPVCVLCHIRLDKKWGIFYSSATLAAFMVSRPFLNWLTQYVFKSYHNSVYINSGLEMSYLLMPFMAFGVCLALKPFWEKRDKDAVMLMNMTAYSAMIWLFIVRHLILERFSLYVYIYVIIAIPSAISCLLAGPEVHAQIEETKKRVDGYKGKAPKELTAKMKELVMTVSDGKKFYWSAVAAVLFFTLIYNQFGFYRGFHNVFPYKSVLPWVTSFFGLPLE